MAFAKTGIPGEDDRMGTITDAELPEDVVDVISDGLLADLQRHRDLVIAQRRGQEIQHSQLTGRELGERGLRGGIGRSFREPIDFLEELPPSGLVRKQDVIAAFERHELGTADRCRYTPALLEGDPRVMAGMQHKGRTAYRAR